ncbi:excalibur calcium-binding domain-containing protein [Sinorhizobium fredii]
MASENGGRHFRNCAAARAAGAAPIRFGEPTNAGSLTGMATAWRPRRKG